MVRMWEEVLATTMVGIAEQDGGHAELYLTQRGQVIGRSLVHPAFWLVGETFSHRDGQDQFRQPVSAYALARPK